MLKKKLQFKKKEIKKTVQPKKEYIEMPKKKELISEPDKSMSVCFSREQLFRIKTKMHTDERMVEYIERVLA